MKPKTALSKAISRAETQNKASKNLTRPKASNLTLQRRCMAAFGVLAVGSVVGSSVVLAIGAGAALAVAVILEVSND